MGKKKQPVKKKASVSAKKQQGKKKAANTNKRLVEKKVVTNANKLRYRVVIILLVVLGFLFVFGGVIWSNVVRANEYEQRQEAYATEMTASLAEYYEDYEGEVPKLEFEVERLDEIEEKLGWMRAKKYLEQKQQAQERVDRLRKFAEIRGRVEELFQDGILKSDTEVETMDALKQELGEMPEGYEKALREKLGMMQGQYAAMIELKEIVPGMFADEGMTEVKDDLIRERYEEIKAKADSLPQREIAEQYAEALKKVDEVLTERERIAEEARRKAAEEYRRRQAEIAAAWRVMNVPYWSQNGEGVKNGCEAAALLMALQYKGYLGGMNLRTYAEMMPKSDDPFSGFRGNIFESAGSDAPFWIAPGPLAAFGRSSSGGANVVDITGSSLDALDAEVAAGNPVVIYLTLGYTAPKAWRFGAPANLHVMLLTGYNALTGVQRVTDPLTIGGRRTYDLPKAQVESILNATGNRAVVVR